ncbi:MAG: DUF134 domain-containing protein [Methanomicrobiaceae archaeon]|nr:DUF134 domain-containing protein [Methanomicrobiaceae archaeon]
MGSATPGGGKRGRPRVSRILSGDLSGRCFTPCPPANRDGETVLLRREELETLRLVELEGLEQEAAASRTGISRRTLWRDLHEARRKVADALVNGKTIEIEGCAIEGGEFCRKQRQTRGGGDRRKDLSLYFHSYE